MPRPDKPHPKGKLRGWEKIKQPPPPDETPDPDPLPPPEPPPEPPPPEPDPPPDDGAIPDHPTLRMVYLYPEGEEAAAKAVTELAEFEEFVDDMRLWTWEKSGGITWYHWEVFGDAVYPLDANGEPTIPFGHRGDPNLQWGGFAHYAQDYVGAIWRGLGDWPGGELGMALFNSRPHEGGYAGGRTGHAAHGFWTIASIMGEPWPEPEESHWTPYWPRLARGGWGHELYHAFGGVSHEPGFMGGGHVNWPSTYLDPLTIEQMELSPWLKRGPRPTVGNWRRW